MTVVSEDALLAELQIVFRDALGIDPIIPIDRETRFFADLGLASIDAVVLGEAIQRHFDRPVPFGELMADLGRRERARPGHRRAGRLPPSPPGQPDCRPGRTLEESEPGHAPDPCEQPGVPRPAGGLRPRRGPDPRADGRPVDLVPLAGDAGARPRPIG